MNSLLEKLAELEHEQWAYWTEYMFNNLTIDNLVRWRNQVRTPYEELSEKEKESDREWARKAIKIMNSTGYIRVPKEEQ